jgi:hypothetical protein
VIVAARHLHMSAEEGAAYGLKDGDVVSLRMDGIRSVTMENVVVRCGEGHVLEAHIDKDEANACGLEDGTLCRILIPGKPGASELPLRQEPPKKETMLDLTGEKARLITEENILAAERNGYRAIRFGKDAIVTPLARDAAAERQIELIKAIG